MKISLINPPFLFPDKVEFVYSQVLGLRYLSSFLKTNQQHEINFIDALMLGFSNVKKYANGYSVSMGTNDIIEKIPKDTELIGVSVPFSQMAPVAHELIDGAKRSFPEALIVMGGVYLSTQPQLALTSKAKHFYVCLLRKCARAPGIIGENQLCNCLRFFENKEFHDENA